MIYHYVTKLLAIVTIFFLPFQLWHRLFLAGYIFAAALVHMWQLVEQAKSPSVTLSQCYLIVKTSMG